MKRLWHTSWLILLVLLPLPVSGSSPVKEQQARRVALEWMEQHPAFFGERIPGTLLDQVFHGEQQVAYVFSLEPSGWIMISSNDGIRPVLGYSLEDTYRPRQTWKGNAGGWMEARMEQIARYTETPGAPVDPGWIATKSASSPNGTEVEPVEPLIEAEWDQGAGWNEQCPDDPAGPGGHALVGCGAVALAQCLTVFSAPVSPAGIVSYQDADYGTIEVNFDMQDAYRWDSMSMTLPDEDNTELLYHAAVAVKMDFGPTGSSSSISNLRSALRNTFHYSPDVRLKERGDDDDAWKAMLVEELQSGQPVIYRGDDGGGSAGHVFNIDGVGVGMYFSVNWGWGGFLNGYFPIDDLTPGDDEFTQNHYAITGIRPPAAGPTNILLSGTAVEEDQPPGTYVASVEVEDEVEGVYSYTCLGPWNIFIEDYGDPYFYIEGDSLKTLYTFDYTAGSMNEKFLRIVVTDTLGNEFARDFFIDILPADTTDLVPGAPGTGFRVYPVPVKHRMVVEPDPADAALYQRVRIVSMEGRIVKTVPMEGSRCEVDMTGIPAGVYGVMLEGLPQGGRRVQVILKR